MSQKQNVVGRGVVAVMAFLGMMGLKNGDNLARFFWKNSDEVVTTVVRKNSDDAAEMLGKSRIDLNIQGGAGWDNGLRGPKHEYEDLGKNLATRTASMAARNELRRQRRNSQRQVVPEFSNKQAFRDSATIDGIYEIGESREVLLRRGDGTFGLNDVEKSSKVEYDNNQIEGPDGSNISTTILSLTWGMYENRTLVRLPDGRVQMVMEGLAWDYRKGAMYYGSNVDVEFIQGDFARYTMGSKVALRLTKEGQTKQASDYETQLAQHLKNSIEESMEVECYAKLRFHVQEMPQEIITMDLNSMEVVAEGPWIFEFQSTLYW